MPPKKQVSSETTPSKSLLNFFDRSPDAHLPGSTGSASTRKHSIHQGLKRHKGKTTPRSIGTLNAPLVISDDEAVEQDLPETNIIDISDDDAPGHRPSFEPKEKHTSTSLHAKRDRERSSIGNATSAFTLRPAQPADEPAVESAIKTTLQTSTSKDPGHGPTSGGTSSSDILRQTGPAYRDVMDIGSQKSELEQALEEEEGQWNEGDEEGMGMEDLEIADEEDAFRDQVLEDDTADDPERALEGGEKRKRKGKQRMSTKDCSPEIIAVEDSDSGDDDSLGGREDVDNFDVDEDECPICGRTFVGLQGDVSRRILYLFCATPL